MAQSGSQASSAKPGTRPAIALTNARLFDGTADRLQAGLTVIAEGGIIADIRTGPPSPDLDARIIDCGGGTLMPGLIDAHWHTMLSAITVRDLMTSDIGDITLRAAAEARQTLLRGFTSVRDMAGPCFSLKRAIDSHLVDGPRIWPSGAIISQSGGHGDFRCACELPALTGTPGRTEALNFGIIADGADAVLTRSREQLALGASQLKLAVGGGIVSLFDPIDVTQYTEREVRAAVEAAENWGTYVAVHAYTSRSVRMALKAGVRSIEHGHLIDEETAELIGASDAWLSTQPFVDDGVSIYPEGSPQRRKQVEIYDATDAIYRRAKTLKLNVAWGTDILFDPAETRRQNARLVVMQRWYEPHEVLRMATATNAKLLALSGSRAPYPGQLGVIAKGALADLLVVDGDPLANLALLGDPDRNLKLIMKDGLIYKNAL